MNAYEAVTARLIEHLEKGVVPWRQPWKNTSRGAYLPTNFATGRSYRGINFAMLLCSGFATPQWMTYKQAQAIGAQVRKGERGTPVVFWQFPGRGGEDSESGDTKKAAPWCKQYTVFNIAQVDGISADLPFDAPAFDGIAEAQAIIDGYMASPSHPKLHHGGSNACYVELYDAVYMPDPSTFRTPDTYYCTAFHEFGHSTAHHARLGRNLTGKFGSKLYAQEELVAEFTAAFLCAQAGIGSDDLDGHNAAYIDNWLRTLRGDSRIAITAAQRAQKAADYILGLSQEQELEVAA